MIRADRIALVIACVAIAASYLVALRVFELLPHIEDEMAYVWQAQVLATGKLTLTSPPDPQSIMIPFVVDYHGQRFGKYPLGWPLLLATGLLLHAGDWVNPILAGLDAWLIYCLGKKLFGERVGLLAEVLTVSSPFFLMNSGSLLSHPWALFLSLSFALAWLDTFAPAGLRNGLAGETAPDPVRAPIWLTVLVAGLSLGVLAMTRPLTALGVALPFFFHGAFLLVRGDRSVRAHVLMTGLLAAAVAALVPLWQYAVTRDALLNPYTLWWKYDKVGFGPGFGNEPGGHNLFWAAINLQFSLEAGWGDFFGWNGVSWLFLPFGLIALGKNVRGWLVTLVFPSIILLYTTYWIGSTLYGPRYYYEGFYSLSILTAAGIFWLGERVFKAGALRKWMQLAVTLLVLFLLGNNLFDYLPKRLEEMTDLYGINRTMLEPFATPLASQQVPALVVVHFQKVWTEYGGLLDLENPELTSPFIFALARDPASDAMLAQDYPDRHVVYYYTDTPDAFYDSPR